MRTVLRDRNYRLLLLGQVTSAFGDYAMFLAIGVWAKDLTGSNAAAGLAVLPFAIPSLFGPALGVWVDRFPRRWVMIATDLVAATAMLSLLLVDGTEDLWLLYVVSFVYGTCVTVYQGARAGLLMAMLPDEEIGDANGLLQSSNQAMRLAAPLVGAGLFAVAGGPAVAVLDAGTFLASALILLALRSPDLERRTDEVRFVAELRDGLAHIARSPSLRRLTIGTAVVMLLVGMQEVLIFAVIDEGLGRPPEFLGVIATAQGAGAIVAGIAAGWVLRGLGELRAIAVASFAAAGGLLMFGTAVLPLALIAAVAFGVANTLFIVAYTTVMQVRTTLEMQGRVMTAVEAIITLPFLISIAIGAAIVDVLEVRWIYVAEAIGMALVAVYFLRSPADGAPAGGVGGATAAAVGAPAERVER
jgi:MFS family permease